MANWQISPPLYYGDERNTCQFYGCSSQLLILKFLIIFHFWQISPSSTMEMSAIPANFTAVVVKCSYLTFLIIVHSWQIDPPSTMEMSAIPANSTAPFWAALVLVPGYITGCCQNIQLARPGPLL